jgi:hypothetical protein
MQRVLDDRGPIRQSFVDLRRREDLTRCRGRDQPGGQVYRVAEVVTAHRQDLAVGDPGADLHPGLAGLGMVDKIECRLREPCRIGVDPHHGVAEELHDPPAAGMHHVAGGCAELVE